MSSNKSNSKKKTANTGKAKQKASGVSKIFYLIMLLLIVTSSFVRISGSNRRRSTTTNTPTPAVAKGGGLAALIFTYHNEDIGSGACEDLTIDSAGNAVYSNCGHGVEKQYQLSDSEQTLMTSWENYYQTINVDQSNGSGSISNAIIKLYLNGQGDHQADDSATQQLETFAQKLVTKINPQT